MYVSHSPSGYPRVLCMMANYCLKFPDPSPLASLNIFTFLLKTEMFARHSHSLVSMTLPLYISFRSIVISWDGGLLLKLDSLQASVWYFEKHCLMSHALPDISSKQEFSYPLGRGV